jgi:hypothetical protein
MSFPELPRTTRRPQTWGVAAVLALASVSSHAQGVDQAIDEFFATTFGWFVNLIFYSVPLGEAQFPLIVGWLLAAAVVFTVYFGFPQLSRFKLAIDLIPTPTTAIPAR